ncbi:DUF6691 family protein [Tritonibacter horizontis]|uniref:YeeE/YedE family protein n=1 Tax=Tritonibacter horizontis TaxID=1768241 RepID=A0A132BVI6_9RHOB|nr:DUF6691 family protein [Tritonibacter horizontis]KUP92304.1 hypothetical protein TRIHO_27920 [Tritonibacter horizontis]
MLRFGFSLISGALFGLGLLISGMTDTKKVQGFLDILGAWDPTLAFVMGGALVPMALAWRWTRGRAPLVGGAFPALPAAPLDRNLILGSLLFGIGWALAGLCPGPALASLSFGGAQGLLFVAAMALGMRIAPALRLVLDRRAAKA